MNNILLAIDITDPSYVPETWSEKLSYGGQMLGVGLLTVFSVLIVIWFSLVIFKKLFYDLPNMKKNGPKPKKVKEPKPKKEKKEKKAPVAEPAPAASPYADPALIAAITAAIATERKRAGAVGGFRVVSFRRK